MREEEEVTPSQVGAAGWEDWEGGKGGGCQSNVQANQIILYMKCISSSASRKAGGLLFVFSVSLRAARRAVAAAPPLRKQRRWAFYMTIFLVADRHNRSK